MEVEAKKLMRIASTRAAKRDEPRLSTPRTCSEVRWIMFWSPSWSAVWLLGLLLLGFSHLGGHNGFAVAAAQPEPQSVFTVQKDGKTQPGCTASLPNDQTVDVSFIEFSDDGSFVKPRQLDAALACITQARRQNSNGALVVLFIHGWHHNANWNTQTNGGDAHFADFRRVLMSLALREAERYMPGPAGRRVVGIYLGWNGDPKQGLISKLTDYISAAAYASFWDRYKVATRIAEGVSIRQTLSAVIDRAKEPLPTGATPDSPLLMIGHSMGALMLETAFLSVLKQEDQGAARTSAAGISSCAAVERNGQPARFPDVVLLLNSAAGSEVTTNLAALIEQNQIRKVVTCGAVPFRAPLLVSATSEADTATGKWFPRSQRGRRTAANAPELRSHRLVRSPVGAVCTPKPSGHLVVDFNQSWHCLRGPAIQNGTLRSVVLDLPQTTNLRSPCHVRYRLEPVRQNPDTPPHWVFQIPESIVKDHNDIFNAQSRQLIMGLMQVSGSVMSLASDWLDTFEADEGTCTLDR